MAYNSITEMSFTNAESFEYRAVVDGVEVFGRAVPKTIFLAGLAAAAAAGLLGNTIIRSRSVGGFVANVTVEENHSDELVITDHPIEQGTVVSDHVPRGGVRDDADHHGRRSLPALRSGVECSSAESRDHQHPADGRDHHGPEVNSGGLHA